MFNKIKNEIKTEVEAMNIGNNISALRKKKGITQEELANELGVSAQAVSTVLAPMFPYLPKSPIISVSALMLFFVRMRKILSIHQKIKTQMQNQVMTKRIL